MKRRGTVVVRLSRMTYHYPGYALLDRSASGWCGSVRGPRARPGRPDGRRPAILTGRDPDPALRTSAAIVRWLLIAAAPLVPLTGLSQLLGLPFRLYAFAVWGWLLAVAGFALYRRVRGARPAAGTAGDRATLLGLCAMSLIAAALATCVHVASRDDYYYAPNPVHVLAHPSTAMGFEVHGLFSGDAAPFHSASWSTAVSFEYAEAALAYGLGVDFLLVYHVLAPALFAGLVPWVLYGLLRKFDARPSRAALATAALMLTLLLMGDTLRTFGNYFLLRAHQGKTVGFMLGLPLFVSLSIDYLRAPRSGTWWQLVGLTTWMCGTTTASIVLFPPLALALAVGHLDIDRWPVEQWWRIVRYGASQFYLVAYALVLLVFSGNMTSHGSPMNEFWPADFMGHVRFFVDAQQPVTVVAFLFFAPLALILADSATRALLAGWWITLIAVCLNPLVAGWLMEHVTSANIYWRLFYLTPFVLSIGLFYSRLFERLEALPRGARGAAAGALLAALALLAAVAPFSSLRGAYGIGLPEIKLPHALRAEASAVISAVPPGPMLAPTELCGVIPMLHAGYPQVRIRQEGVRQWLGERGKPEEAMLRLRASEFARGNTGEFEAFAAVLDLYPQIRSVLLRRTPELDGSREAHELLRDRGFTHRAEFADHTAFWK